MSFCKRMDIQKSEEITVFSYLVAGDFTGDDTGKDSHRTLFLAKP
jgi:hypothetical protein